MSPKGRNRNTRNSSQTRPSGQELQKAGAGTAEKSSAAQRLLSPQDGKALPEGNQNKDQMSKKGSQVGLPKNQGGSNTEGNNKTDLCSKDKQPKLSEGHENEITLNPSTQAPTLKAGGGDNKEERDNSSQAQDNQSSFHGSRPGDPWHEAFLEMKATSQELKAIRVRMDKLDSIEEATSSLTAQLSMVVGKTEALESKVEDNTTQVRDLQREIDALKNRVEKQDKKIEELSNLKEDYKKATKKTLGEMNNLVKSQKEQADSMHEANNHMKNEIMDRVEEKVEEISEDLAHTKLKNQAYHNRNNLVIIGLKEETDKNSKKVASDFIDSALKVKDIEISDAYRIGNMPAEGSAYSRPLVVKFPKKEERNKVWKKKAEITAEEDDHKIRIQADLPKKLREGMRVIHRVARAAAASQKYKSAVVKDYAILWKGKEYTSNQLESLPRPIRPSTLATRTSDQALVFFSRHSKLSNHHPSIFKIQGTTYHNVEQFLAHKRAILSAQDSMIQKALQAENPAEAKAILNNLREDHTEEWNNSVERWATEGVRAKFNQNENLARFLYNTGNLQLGEASRNLRWGVGMDLDNPDVLDFGNWPDTSNLLGKTLMKIRAEIKKARETPRK